MAFPSFTKDISYDIILLNDKKGDRMGQYAAMIGRLLTINQDVTEKQQRLQQIKINLQQQQQTVSAIAQQQFQTLQTTATNTSSPIDVQFGRNSITSIAKKSEILGKYQHIMTAIQQVEKQTQQLRDATQEIQWVDERISQDIGLTVGETV